MGEYIEGAVRRAKEAGRQTPNEEDIQQAKVECGETEPDES